MQYEREPKYMSPFNMREREREISLMLFPINKDVINFEG